MQPPRHLAGHEGAGAHRDRAGSVTRLTLIFPALAVGLVAVSVTALRRRAAASGIRTRLPSALAFVLIAWTGVVAATMFAARDHETVQTFLGFGLGLVALVAAIRLASSAHPLLDSLPQSWLIGVHVYRALAFVVFIMWARHELPAQYAIPVASGDMVFGVSAPWVASLAEKDRLSAKAIVRWNLASAAEMIVALIMAILSAPWPLRTFMNEPSAAAMFTTPMVLVPTVHGPFLVACHVLSIRKAREARRQGL